MATRKQKLAVDKLVGNGGNVTKAMRESGYSENTLHTPSKLLDSKGFLELMDEYGLTDDLLIKSLVDDIRAKPSNRTQELTLAIKMRGRIIDRQDITTAGEQLKVALVEFVGDHATEPKNNS